MRIVVGLIIALLVVGIPLTITILVAIWLNENKPRMAARLLDVSQEPEDTDEEHGLMAVRESLRSATAASRAAIEAEATCEAERGQRRASEQGASGQPSRSSAPIYLTPLSDAVEFIDKAHHVAIMGGTGDGKSWLGQAILALLPADQLFCIIDCNWWPGKWSDLPVITTNESDSFAPILKALHGIQKEAVARKLVTWKGKGSSPGPKLNIVWDEVNETMEELSDAGPFLRRWLRRIRYLNMKLFIFPQSERVGALGLEGHGDAKKNMLWVYIGSDARAKCDWLLSKKKMSEDVHAYLTHLDYPCLMEWQAGYYAIDLSEVPDLVARPIANAQQRSWTPEGVVSKQDLTDDLELTEEEQLDLSMANLENTGKTIAMPAQPTPAQIEAQVKISLINRMDWSIYAQMVAEDKITEGALIFQLFEVKPGGSPVYQAAKDKLKEALDALTKEQTA